MTSIPIDKELVAESLLSLGISDVGKASIREVVAIANLLEEKSGNRFVRMEMGVPGLPPSVIGVDAEIEALKAGVASVYPLINGIAPLKSEASRFIKLFMDTDVSPAGCLPTAGSMQGTFAAIMAVSNIDERKNTVLFLDPGFPVQKQQAAILGVRHEGFDIYDFRGSRLRDKLESILAGGHISALVYSNPNNPGWICLTDEELAIIGELAEKYDVIVMEDLAYFAMDFRKDLYTPGRPSYQPTVAKYTDNYILFISGSKIFSYAGQRIGLMAISDKLYDRDYEYLNKRFGSTRFGNVIIYRILHATTSGTSHSSQYALAAMLKAASDGHFNFVEDLKEYGRRAGIIKAWFLNNGFDILYDKDGDEPIADGFYFTVAFPGMDGGQLLNNLLHYGISAITLKNTGSTREGLRICVSHVGRDRFQDLEQRLEQFGKRFKDNFVPEFNNKITTR